MPRYISAFQCYAAHAHLRRDISKREFSHIFLTLEDGGNDMNSSKKGALVIFKTGWYLSHWQLVIDILFVFVFMHSRKYLFNYEIQLKWVEKIKNRRELLFWLKQKLMHWSGGIKGNLQVYIIRTVSSTIKINKVYVNLCFSTL